MFASEVFDFEDDMLYAGLLAGRPPASPPQTVPLPLLKVLYFLNGWSGASFGRFATLFYVAKHLSSKQIGYIEAAQPLARSVGNQIAGWRDRLRSCGAFGDFFGKADTGRRLPALGQKQAAQCETSLGCNPKANRNI